MDMYETEDVIISKQYGIKESQNPQDQAVLLGIAFIIMPELLHKYPDLLVIDSTSRHNGLGFPNTAFMVRSDESHGRIVATFISDKETTPVVDLMFKLMSNLSSFSLHIIITWLFEVYII